MFIRIILCVLLLILSIFLSKPLFFKHQPSITTTVTTFEHLPAWSKTEVLPSLQALEKSCQIFLRQPPDTQVGNHFFPLKAKDWRPLCQALPQALKTETDAKKFFETWFEPVFFSEKQAMTGLFTGYYFPTLEGSLTPSHDYQTPIYGLPNDLITVKLQQFSKNLPPKTLVGRLHHQQLVPYYDRQSIDHGALLGKAPILAWVKNPIDRLFIEIQGSGIIQLQNQPPLILGYAGENGASYVPIARVLIDKGVFNKDSASMQRIRAYLETHPEECSPIMHQNPSFVFFKILKQKGALGAQGILLTAGYSLAVDPQFVPLGVPIWLKTTRPDEKHNQTLPFERLMIAQDTGGAIKGAVRGDIYWGEGPRATEIAGRMKDRGQYWILKPKKTQN